MTLEQKLKIGLVLNTAFTVFEFIMGFISGSLALVSDAGHNLTDSLSLMVSWIAEKIAKRKATPEHTFGYGKSTIIAALINSSVLIILALVIFYKAYQRLLRPEPVSGGTIMLVALAGVAVNGTIALMFRSHSRNLNIKSAYLNMAYDTLASVGALAAGIIIIYTHKTFADPIISVVIGIMLLISGWKVVDKAIHVLLEGVPENINVKMVQEAISKIANVKKVNDLHVWTIASEKAALSCQVIFEEKDLAKDTETIKEIKRMLNQNFNISHATIEATLAADPPHNH
ncbi:MAG: cation diffusion facilitator family transporter [Patescibacteria group bacterium]|nr:cation diffusion facilitator family transporter [Patescibacteria group bacterium]